MLRNAIVASAIAAATIAKPVLKLKNATAPLDTDVCSIIDSALPDECVCKNVGAETGHIDCNVNFLGLDKISLTADLAPCVVPAHVALAISEQDFGLNYNVTLDVGYSGDIAIPGLNLTIPFVGNVAAQLAVDLAGDLEELQVYLGLDACVILDGEKVCGEDVPIVGKQLPVWLLEGSFDFDGVCDK